MAKRKLSRQQRQRIQQIQARRQERARERARRLEEELDDAALGPEETGLVISQQRSHLVIEDDAGELVHCLSRANLGPVVCGDRVIWQRSQAGYGVVGATRPRDSVLLKPALNGDIKPIAANVDQLVIVIAARPEPSLALVDQYLAAARLSGIAPLLLVNKSDLLDTRGRQSMTDTLDEFTRLGIPVVFASAGTGDGLETFTNALNERTSVLVGQSGVGKSSMINALVPDRDVQTGRLSNATGLGRHTTSTTTLYHLPTGGSLVDSPGVRQFRLWNLDPETVADGFVELSDLSGQCRFNDCRHEQEPDCAILKAVETGAINARRFESYRNMVNDARLARRVQGPGQEKSG